MDKIENIDLREALHDIAWNNTFYHLEHDFDISIDQMERGVKLGDPAEKNLIWVSYPAGIDCYSEPQVFQKGTRDHHGVLYHGFDGQRDRKLAYAVEITGVEDGKLRGNLVQIDIKPYAETVREAALDSQTMRIYLGDLRDGEQITMPKAEFDGLYPHVAPNMVHYRNEPEDPAALQVLMEKVRQDREAACVPRDLWLHISNLYDDRRAFYSGQLLDDLAKLAEPNSPDRQAFSVTLDPSVAYAYGAEDLSRLLDALPYPSAAFIVDRNHPRDMRLVIPREEVLQHRRAGQEKPSVLAQLQESKKAAAQREQPPKTAPKRDNNREV